MTAAHRTALFFTLFLVLGAVYTFAQDTPDSPNWNEVSVARSYRVLSLEEAYTLAEQNSIALQRQAIDLSFDRIRARNLWAQVFPSINITGGARYIIPNNDSPRSDPSYTASLNLRLDLNAGLPLTMANISLAYRNSLLNYEQARRILINNTSKAFYSLLAQRNYLDVLEGTMQLAAQQFERDRIARQSGFMGELDFLSSQLSSERARLAYNRVQTEYRNNVGQFLTALGLDNAETVELDGSPPVLRVLVLDPERLIAERLFLRPDIIAQRNEIDRLKNSRNESILSARAPSVNLSASWGASVDNGFDDTVSAGISVTIPIDSWIPGTRTAQSINRDSGEYQKAILELENMERNARQEIRFFTENIGDTWTEVEINRLQVQNSQRAYQLAEQSYRAGGMNFFNFETTRNRLTEARQQLLQSELNYILLVLDLALILNLTAEELLHYSAQ